MNCIVVQTWITGRMSSTRHFTSINWVSEKWWNKSIFRLYVSQFYDLFQIINELTSFFSNRLQLKYRVSQQRILLSNIVTPRNPIIRFYPCKPYWNDFIRQQLKLYYYRICSRLVNLNSKFENLFSLLIQAQIYAP